MRAQELEPETEELLLRSVPGLEEQWKGATADEIARIEQIVGRQLPRFYRWFLMRMGCSMGPLAYPTLDFSVSRVFTFYADNLRPSCEPLLMIGYETDIVSPMHVWLDLERMVREDALVTKVDRPGGDVYEYFETFREMLVWGGMSEFRVGRTEQRCGGTLFDPDGDVLARLDPVLQSLGFSSPVQHGAYCGFYERSDVCLLLSCGLGGPPEMHALDVGGKDAGRIRRVLGEITSETPLELRINEWDPPLD